jgi:hypothetical protein
MSRITIPTMETAPEGSRALLDAVHTKFGVVPNLFRVFGLGPGSLPAGSP